MVRRVGGAAASIPADATPHRVLGTPSPLGHHAYPVIEDATGAPPLLPLSAVAVNRQRHRRGATPLSAPRDDMLSNVGVEVCVPILSMMTQPNVGVEGGGGTPQRNSRFGIRRYARDFDLTPLP